MTTILELCKDSTPKSFNPGEVLIAEGNKSGFLYILIEGVVEIIKGGHVINTVSEPGSIFGEISLLLDLPHMATVKVAEPSSFYMLSGEDSTFDPEDISSQIATVLAKRLNNITNYLVDVKNRSAESEEQLNMVCEALEKYIYKDK